MRASRLVLGCGLLLSMSCNSSPPQSSATKEAPSAVVANEKADKPVDSAPPAAVTPPAASAAPTSLKAPDDVAAPPADASKTASGLASKVLTKGTGTEHPKPEDTVKVHYTGWTKDGKMFDSSVTRGEPTSFRLNQVIKGWTEGVALMVVGEKRRLWIPAALAYGDRPQMGAPSGDLVFDVELLDITAAPKPFPVPPDVKAPPATATKTASGLAYRVLKKGTGTRSPKLTDRVTVNYTGWTPDGKMFDSSAKTGGPLTARLDHLIKGWGEGLALVHEGDTVRLWIPAALAYGDKPTRPGAPAGPLVFDIELLAVQ